LIFFDFALIGFVLTFFVKDWHLTFGQSGAILFASGVAAIPGGILFGWLGDKIGRRKVFMMIILTLSFATGVMALAPENGWIFIATMRFIVGLGVGGLAAVDLPLLQEFVPASKRGWVSGLSIGLLPLGPLLAALFSASLGATIGWRGLFAIGLVPAAFAFVIRLWVPESPRWLLGQGRFEEARRSLAWALKLDPRPIQPPASLPEQPHVPSLELFNIRAVSMQQTRYDTSDLVLAADPSVFSRFMISPTRRPHRREGDRDRRAGRLHRFCLACFYAPRLSVRPRELPGASLELLVLSPDNPSFRAAGEKMHPNSTVPSWAATICARDPVARRRRRCRGSRPLARRRSQPVDLQERHRTALEGDTRRRIASAVVGQGFRLVRWAGVGAPSRRVRDPKNE
jgi:hypothetical protein